LSQTEAIDLPDGGATIDRWDCPTLRQHLFISLTHGVLNRSRFRQGPRQRNLGDEKGEWTVFGVMKKGRLMYHLLTMVAVICFSTAIAGSNTVHSASRLAYGSDHNFGSRSTDDVGEHREVRCSASCRMRSLFFPWLGPPSSPTGDIPRCTGPRDAQYCDRSNQPGRLRDAEGSTPSPRPVPSQPAYNRA
jgi:hypothetical protein